jgi:hypothetical protein
MGVIASQGLLKDAFVLQRRHEFPVVGGSLQHEVLASGLDIHSGRFPFPVGRRKQAGNPPPGVQGISHFQMGGVVVREVGVEDSGSLRRRQGDGKLGNVGIARIAGREIDSWETLGARSLQLRLGAVLKGPELVESR